MAAVRSPGVYLEDRLVQPNVVLPTGIPAFIGFTDAIEKLEVVVLQRKEEFITRFKWIPESYLKEAVDGFFENGGSRCYIVGAELVQDQPTQDDRHQALIEAINSKTLASLPDLDLVAVPDAMTLSNQETVIHVQQTLVQHCAKADRLAILDVTLSKAQNGQQHVLNYRQDLIKGLTKSGVSGVSAALYYPWIQVGVLPNDRLVPPCGHIAGIFARSDRTRGVFKAPANEEIRGAIGLEVSISDAAQAVLNAEGINCLRVFPGRGIRVWGARTLSSDRNWHYINVHRLVLTIKRWINLNMAWAAFEPNTPQLWVRIQRELRVYLTQLWQAGGLKGETPEQAFYIRCDAAINPVENRETGQVMTEIGLAPAAPAEFIVVQLTHRAGTTEIT